MQEEELGGRSEAKLLAEVKQLKSEFQPSQKDVKILEEAIVFSPNAGRSEQVLRQSAVSFPYVPSAAGKPAEISLVSPPPATLKDVSILHCWLTPFSPEFAD